MELPLRPNVCLLIINNDNLIFLGERNDAEGVWQFPQGGVENLNDIASDALREAAEELGASESFFQIIRKLNTINEYEFVNPPVYAKDTWRGQSQTFWLLRFKGGNSNIDLAAHHPEFKSYRWCKKSEVMLTAEKKRLPAYIEAMAECHEIQD